MSNPNSDSETDDVLGSIRRLVSVNERVERVDTGPEPAAVETSENDDPVDAWTADAAPLPDHPENNPATALSSVLETIGMDEAFVDAAADRDDTNVNSDTILDGDDSSPADLTAAPMAIIDDDEPENDLADASAPDDGPLMNPWTNARDDISEPSDMAAKPPVADADALFSHVPRNTDTPLMPYANLSSPPNADDWPIPTPPPSATDRETTLVPTTPANADTPRVRPTRETTLVPGLAAVFPPSTDTPAADDASDALLLSPALRIPDPANDAAPDADDADLVAETGADDAELDADIGIDDDVTAEDDISTTSSVAETIETSIDDTDQDWEPESPEDANIPAPKGQAAEKASIGVAIPALVRAMQMRASLIKSPAADPVPETPEPEDVLAEQLSKDGTTQLPPVDFKRRTDDPKDHTDDDADDGIDDAERVLHDLTLRAVDDAHVHITETVSAKLPSAQTAPTDMTVAIDEDMMRDMVNNIVREELQGALGERITRNVRKLVRREIHQALTSKDFE